MLVEEFEKCIAQLHVLVLRSSLNHMSRTKVWMIPFPNTTAVHWYVKGGKTFLNSKSWCDLIMIHLFMNIMFIGGIFIKFIIVTIKYIILIFLL